MSETDWIVIVKCRTYSDNGRPVYFIDSSIFANLIKIWAAVYEMCLTIYLFVCNISNLEVITVFWHFLLLPM